MKIQHIAIKQIIPYKDNPRYNESSINKVAASIKEFGWQQPIVVDNDMIIIAGHTRYMAACRMGLKEVPVHIASDLTKDQVMAYRIADNRLNEDSSWNNELLHIELDKIDDEFNLTLIGFDNDELEQLLNKDNKQNNPEQSLKAKEFFEEDFKHFKYQCPKCRFEWN